MGATLLLVKGLIIKLKELISRQIFRCPSRWVGQGGGGGGEGERESKREEGGGRIRGL